MKKQVITCNKYIVINVRLPEIRNIDSAVKNRQENQHRLFLILQLIVQTV